MIPVDFPESNQNFGPPPELDPNQCNVIRAHVNRVMGGSLDGSLVVVVAWLPGPEDLDRLKQGRPIYLSVMGGLVPHYLSTDFHAATHPA